MSTGETAAAVGLGRFVPVWLGQVVSFLGVRLASFALGVEVFQETGSVTGYALIGLATLLPTVLLSPLAGVAADRFDRRSILVAASVGSAAPFLLLFVVLGHGRAELWQLYAIVAAGSACGAFVWPTLQSSVTLLVGREHLERAAGMVQVGFAVGQIGGPLLAGALLDVLELRGLVLLTVAGYLGHAAVLLFVRFPKPRASAAGEAASAAGTSVVRQTVFGLRFIRERPGLWHLMTLFGGVNFAAGMVLVLLTPLVLSFSTPPVLGLVMAVASSGALVGGILMSVWGGAQRRRVPVVLGTLGGLGALLLLGGLRPSATLVATAAFFYMAGIPVISSSAQALWQSKVPEDVQGRVFAVSHMVAGAGAPLAMALAGPLADHVFEPLLASGGALAGTVGRLIGVGPGRGIGLLLVTLGVFLLGLAAVYYSRSALRRLEGDLPDAVEPAPPEARASTRRRPLPAVRRLGRGPALAVALVLGLLSGLVLLATRPPREAAAAPESFSVERALRDLEVVAAEPHPVGSVAQARVRDYLAAELRGAGLEVEVQRTSGVRRFANLAVVAQVENVVARLAGTTSRRGAVLLVAHYDSTPTSPGASDNGAAVAALLEAARGLARDERLANDVIFLFSDAEEIGLQGARAFVGEHRWADDVAVVLNFDARGHGGAVYVFETGRHNREWIPRFAAGARRPFANSLMNEIYQRLPNDTDFTVFSDAGYAGFNFAFIEGLTHYHSPLDRTADVDRRSLVHHASYAVGLARHLGELDLSGVRRRPPPSRDDELADNRAYFDLAGLRLVHYPQQLGWLFLALAGGALAVLIADARRRRRLSSFGLWQGALAFLGQLVAVPVAITLVWLVLRDTASLTVLQGSTPGAWRYMIAFVCLAVAAVGALQHFWRTFVSTLELTAGALVGWLVLALLTSGPVLPVDANYLFLWPLAGALAAFAYLVRVGPGEQRRWTAAAVLTAALAPAVVLVVPFLAALYVGLQGLAELGGAALVFVVLLGGLAAPLLELASRARPRWPLAAAGLGAVLLALAVWNPGTPHREVRESSVLYAYDADSGERHYFSLDPEPGPWTRQFGFTVHERASIEPFFPFQTALMLRAEAPAAELPAPAVEWTGCRRARGGYRRYDLRLVAGAQARRRLIRFEPASAVVTAELAGVPVSLYEMEGYDASHLLELPVGAPEETLTLRVAGGEPVRVVVVEQYDGLPALPGVAPRPPAELPRSLSPVLRSEITLIRRIIDLETSSTTTFAGVLKECPS